MKYLTVSIFLFISTLCFSQNNLPVREEFDLIIKVDEDGFYEQKIDATPYFVTDNVLQIYPGEKIFIEAEVNNSKIISLKTVSKAIHPEKTIEIEFSQSANNKVHERMTLKVQNPFDKQLKYSAQIYLMNHDKWIETSIIPVFPKIRSYETWHDIILSIVLKDWELLDN